MLLLVWPAMPPSVPSFFRCAQRVICGCRLSLCERSCLHCVLESLCCDSSCCLIATCVFVCMSSGRTFFVIHCVTPQLRVTMEHPLVTAHTAALHRLPLTYAHTHTLSSLLSCMSYPFFAAFIASEKKQGREKCLYNTVLCVFVPTVERFLRV